MTHCFPTTASACLHMWAMPLSIESGRLLLFTTVSDVHSSARSTIRTVMAGRGVFSRTAITSPCWAGVRQRFSACRELRKSSCASSFSISGIDTCWGERKKSYVMNGLDSERVDITMHPTLLRFQFFPKISRRPE